VYRLEMSKELACRAVLGMTHIIPPAVAMSIRKEYDERREGGGVPLRNLLAVPFGQGCRVRAREAL
jgi:hypothetical protein